MPRWKVLSFYVESKPSPSSVFCKRTRFAETGIELSAPLAHGARGWFPHRWPFPCAPGGTATSPQLRGGSNHCICPLVSKMKINKQPLCFLVIRPGWWLLLIWADLVFALQPTWFLKDRTWGENPQRTHTVRAWKNLWSQAASGLVPATSSEPPFSCFFPAVDGTGFWSIVPDIFWGERSVLVHSGCYNKMPQTGCCINNETLFLMAVRMEVWGQGACAVGWGSGGQLLVVPSQGKRGWQVRGTEPCRP